MGTGTYKRVEGVAVPCEAFEAFEAFESGMDRRVRLTEGLEDGAYVSTVFLGLDHRFGEDGPPILWETMIFAGRYNQWQDRYTSEEDAIEGHERAVRMVKGEEVGEVTE